MKKNKSISAAPLYVVLGSLKKEIELNVRVIPLTRAKQKDLTWVYPSEGGNKTVLVSDLNKVDSSDFKNKNVVRKFYRGYCVKSGIKALMELVKSTHENKKPENKIKVSVPVINTIKKKEKAVIVSKIIPVVKKINVVEPAPVSVSLLGKKFSQIDQNDVDAVNSILAGNKEKFAILYKRYYPIINYKYSCNLNFDKDRADDLTADLFARVFQNLHKYKPEYTFNSWISRVAKNFFIDQVRKPALQTVSMDAGVSSERMHNDESDPMVAQIKDNGTLTPEETIIMEQRNNHIKDAIENLDESCKAAITKLFFEDKSYIEISEEMGITLGSTKSIIFRGKAKLKSMIESNKSALALMVA